MKRQLLLWLVVSVIGWGATPFTLSSRDLAPGGKVAEAQVLNGFGCEGGNRSPRLARSGVPEGTQSLVLTCYDPDAPTGSGWWHWVVFNLPPNTRALPEGAGTWIQGGGHLQDGRSPGLPGGAIQSRTDFGVPGYGGPCPPAGGGTHRYIFTLWALRERLALDAEARPAQPWWASIPTCLPWGTLN